MTADKTSNRYLKVFGLAVFLLLPSFDTVIKYFGVGGVAGYFLIGTLLVFAVDRYMLPLFQRSISERTANVLAGLTFATIIAITLVVYPIANTGQFGSGSDADDALVVAAGEILNGNYPYTPNTYLGNPISPMPGSVFLAMPFVVLGAIHLQNIFWLAILFLVCRNYEKSSTSALGLLLAMLAFSPTLIQNIVTGADYVSNSIYVVVSMWILMRTLTDQSSVWKSVLAAILLGIGLSSRSTFMLIMPLYLSVLVQTAGWKQALRYLSIAGITFLAVTLPFWLYDPTGFAPLRVQSEKLKSIENILPFAGIIVPGMAGLIAVVLSFQNMRSDTARFFLNCAIVQLFVVFLTSLLYSLKLGHLDFFLQQSGYGMFSLFFGATAFWMYLYKDSKPVIEQA